MKKAVFWCFLLCVVVLSLLPTNYLPPPVLNIWDKLEHAMAFAVLTMLGLHAYESRPLRTVLGIFLLGGVIEVAQAATGWRYGEWLDLLADAVGIALAVGLILLVRRLRTNPVIAPE
jgi:VanZ family protein